MVASVYPEHLPYARLDAVFLIYIILPDYPKPLGSIYNTLFYRGENS